MNYNTQNAKIASITEKTLIVGIDVGSEIHGIIESVDKIIFQKKDWFYGKYGSQCTFSVPDVLSPDYGGEISEKSYQ